MTGLLDFLRAKLEEDERRAKEASTQRAWWIDEAGDRFVRDTMRRVIAECPEAADAAHIAGWDPKRVLAEVETKRRMIDDITAERHLVVEDDCWFTCAAATEEHDGGESCNDNAGDKCDCGRDARVERRLRLMALPYSDDPAYREEWRP